MPNAAPQEPLPGLEEPTSADVSAVELGVRRTLAALNADEMLTEAHAGKTAVAVALAQVIAHKTKTGRASTVSNDARLLVEVLDSLGGAAIDPAEEEKLRTMMEAWKAEADKADALEQQGSA
jgi:hypothetical protein